MVVVRTTWSVNDSGGRSLKIVIEGTSPSTTQQHGTWWVDDNNAAAWPLAGLSTETIKALEPATPGRSGPLIFCDAPSTILVVEQDENGGATAPTTGEADIYAIIATPAS